jgi:flagellar motor component MotA
MMGILIFSGAILLYLMKKKYHYEFHNQKWTIIIIIVSESAAMIVFTTMTVLNSIYNKDGKNDLNYAETLYEYNGLRSTIQAIGFVLLKPARDPLFGI